MSDEEIKSIQRRLTIMGVGPALMREATEATLTLMSTNMDQESAAKAVGMAMDGQYRQLRQLIPELGYLEKKGLDVNDVLKLITSEVGKTSEAMGNSYQKKVKALNIAWEEHKEIIGTKVLPVVKYFLDLVTDAIHVTFL